MSRVAAYLALLSLAAPAAQQPLAPHQQLAREVYKELIEINTAVTTGSTTPAAEAMAKRFRAAGFPAEDVFVGGPDPRKSNLVVRYRGRAGAARKPILLLAHIDVVEAKKEDWSSGLDPFVFTEKDGYFYGRGTADDKAMAAIFVANLLRMKSQGLVPDRDLVLALTADEEGGDHNGVQWLLANHRARVDAEYGLNEGGGGQSRSGRQDRQSRAGEREDLRRLHRRRHEQGRSQLAAAGRERDLRAGGRDRAHRQVLVPGEAQRSDARVLRQDGGDRARRAGGGLQGDRRGRRRVRMRSRDSPRSRSTTRCCARRA